MYSIDNNAEIFKITYDPISRNHYNSDTALLSRAKKKYDLQGIQNNIYIPLSEAGGVGGLANGYLPTPGTESGDQMVITARDLVVTAQIERKAMKASMKDEGSFARFTKRPVMKAVESYDTAANLLWHGDGTGRIGLTHTTGYVSGTADAPVIQMDTTDFFERWFVKGFQVNFGNAGSTAVENGLFKVASVDVANKRVTFTRLEGTFDLTSGTNADARKIYIQNLFNVAPEGFESTIMKTSSTIYSIPYDEQSWGSLIYDAAEAPPSVSMLNYVFNVQGTRVSMSDLPNLILTSPEIWAILSDIPELQKKITLMPRDKKLTTEYGFGISGLSYNTPDGKNIPIVVDKHCRKNRIYGIYDEVMYMHHMPDHGWWDEDGKVFLRVPRRAWYEGTYGGFYQNVIHPTFQIAIKNVGL